MKAIGVQLKWVVYCLCTRRHTISNAGPAGGFHDPESGTHLVDFLKEKQLTGLQPPHIINRDLERRDLHQIPRIPKAQNGLDSACGKTDSQSDTFDPVRVEDCMSHVLIQRVDRFGRGDKPVLDFS